MSADEIDVQKLVSLNPASDLVGDAQITADAGLTESTTTITSNLVLRRTGNGSCPSP